MAHKKGQGSSRNGRDQKVRVFKYKKRKHYRRTRGHRQSYTALRIDSISL